MPFHKTRDPRRNLTAICATLALIACGALAHAQAVKGSVSPDAPPPKLMYDGLIPGLHKMDVVKKVLGEPEFATRWYNYKMYYPSRGRPGLVDVVHMHGSNPDSALAEVEAASVPPGYEDEGKIRAKLGDPEFELRMATWKLLDYSEEGVRFSLTPEGKTNGVAYFPHGRVRVPPGERKLIDLSKKRQGPQPKPRKVASLNGLRLGVSEVVFSPQKPEWFPHPYKIHDDLKARIAVFSDGKLTVALVGADLFGSGWRELNVIRENVKKFGVDYTVIGMSHNHAAGDTIGVYGHYPTEYIAYHQRQMTAGIKEAYDNMQPVKEMRFVSQELPMDGIRVMHLFRNARNPGLLDPQIALIQAIGMDDKPIATIVQFACHVESLEKGAREISADFPGYMCEQMKKDGMGQPIFLNGALGGMVSGDNPERTHESSHEMGLKLAEIVKKLAPSAQPQSSFEFSVDHRPIEIPMTNPNFKELFESGLRTLHRGRVLSDMMYIKLGEAEIVTLPGELLPEMSFEILERMDGYPRMLIGLANDELGYMIPPYDYRDDAYEETMSQSPAAGLVVRDTAIRMIEELP